MLNCVCSCFSDSRFLSYSPSVLATAIMVSVVGDSTTCDEAEYESQLMTLLKVGPVCGISNMLLDQ